MEVTLYITPMISSESTDLINGSLTFLPIINPDAVLRIAAFTSITFEFLPWNGTVLICQSLSQTNHKQSYPTYFMQTVAWTMAAAVV